MPYVVSILVLVLGVLLLVACVLGVLRALRRFHSAQVEVAGHVQDRVGLLKARAAGLRVAFAERLPRDEQRSASSSAVDFAGPPNGMSESSIRKR